MKTFSTPSYLIVCLALGVGACSSGGSSDSAPPVVSSTNADNTQSTDGTAAVANDEQVILVGAKSGFYSGAGLYQTGFHLVSSTWTSGDLFGFGGSVVTENYTTNSTTQEITVASNVFNNELQEFVETTLRYSYDNSGKVTEYFDGQTGTFNPAYNNDGTISNIVRTDPMNGTLTNSFQYEDGLLTGKIKEWQNPDYGLITTEYVYTYDDNGYIFRSDNIDSGTNTVYEDKKEMAVDALGRVTEILIHSALDGEIEARTVFTYDANNNITQQDLFYADGALGWSIVNTYAANTMPTPNVFGYTAATGYRFIDFTP